jgi:hypothetical protein
MEDKMSPRNPAMRVRLLVVLILASSCGCGETETTPEIRTIRVSGTITYDGKPVQHTCQITFSTQDGEFGPFSAETDKEGKYETDVPPGQMDVTVSVNVDLGVPPEELMKMDTEDVDALIREKGGEHFDAPFQTSVSIEDKVGSTFDLDLAELEPASSL